MTCLMFFFSDLSLLSLTYPYLSFRVSFSFLPKGGQNEIGWIIGGQVCICGQSVWKTRGVSGHAPPVNFDLVQWDGMDSRYRA